VLLAKVDFSSTFRSSGVRPCVSEEREWDRSCWRAWLVRSGGSTATYREAVILCPSSGLRLEYRCLLACHRSRFSSVFRSSLELLDLFILLLAGLRLLLVCLDRGQQGDTAGGRVS
jgi:hypothetical protein